MPLVPLREGSDAGLEPGRGSGLITRALTGRARLEAATHGPLRVLMLPHWPENPYQELLATHLEARGTSVIPGIRSDLWRPLRAARRGIDLVHLHSSGKFTRAHWTALAWLRAAASLAGVVALRALRIPVVWTAHDLHDHDAPRPKLDAAFTWLLARLARGIIVHGDRAWALTRERYGLSDRTTRACIPHGPFDQYADAAVDAASTEELRRPLGLESKHFVFLFLGAIRPYKGVLELLQAFRSFEAQDARLVIRGRARDAEHAERVRTAAADDARVDFQDGFVADSQVARLVGAADTVVAPYRSVLTSGSVILASSLGRPCIAPRMGAIPDALDADAAFLYDPAAPTALAGALRAAYEARERLPAMGAAAHRRSHATSWDRVAERTLETYRACLRAS